ncbi:MAG: transglycosylase SLT domain-containing protein [Betaproteobacteria bacterium]|nr:transglycosylase SLT domain-containing protein [Betaproteobacteria bacterium]
MHIKLIAFLAALFLSTTGHCADEAPQGDLKFAYTLSNPAGDPYQTPQVPGAAVAAQANLWDRIRAGFLLPESNPQLTRTQERWFAAHPGYLDRAVERSRLYLFHIVEEVEKRGMPMEIALLPMIESAFDPQALSPMKASGMWQFIPSTGRVYGLEQNAWFDGRKDVIQATNAALDYLQKLHGMFGDWELALAAYNCGEGCVARARSRGKDGVDYASIKLPTETRNYVPRLVAVRNLVRDPASFGITLRNIPSEPYFLRINLAKPMEARQVARLAEMNLNDFLALNPGFQRRVIHTASQDVLLLPVDRVEAFQFNLHREGLDKLALQSYSARKGEKASGIAARFGVTMQWLSDHNPLKLRRGEVANAQTLMVPSNKSAARAEALPPEPKEPVKVFNAKVSSKGTVLRTHTVRRGDTLDRVARLYRVKVADLRRWNVDLEPLRPGSKLVIKITS